MAILLGLLAAVLYGSSDFTGGLASRKASSVAVNLIGSVCSTALLWVVLMVVPGAAPSLHTVVWGLVGGLGGGVGSLVLYRGLAAGRMSVVGPVSAVGAAVVPVLVGFGTGERPGWWAAAGVLVALPAIALVAASGDGSPRGSERSGLLDGLMAGAAFGLMFVALAQTSSGSGLWPVALEQCSSLLVIGTAAVAAGTRVRLTPRAVLLPVLASLAGSAATLAYYYATRFGMLATVAILTSLYPGVTVLLARTMLGERFGRVQRLGLGLCAFAVIAIAVN
jgi:uncharacterized membrane protein